MILYVASPFYHVANRDLLVPRLKELVTWTYKSYYRARNHNSGIMTICPILLERFCLISDQCPQIHPEDWLISELPLFRWCDGCIFYCFGDEYKRSVGMMAELSLLVSVAYTRRVGILALDGSMSDGFIDKTSEFLSYYPSVAASLSSRNHYMYRITIFDDFLIRSVPSESPLQTNVQSDTGDSYGKSSVEHE